MILEEEAVFKKNQRLLFERFQDIALNTLLVSTEGYEIVDEDSFSNIRELSTGQYFYEGKHEAKDWFSSLLIEDTEVLFVYGVGLGEYYLAALDWLEKQSQRTIVFLEDNPVMIKLFLLSPNAEKLLSNPQALLVQFNKKRALYTFSTLCDYLSFTSFEITSHRAYLDRENYFLIQNEILRESTVRFGILNEFLFKSGQLFAKNIYQNLKHLQGSYEWSKLCRKRVHFPAVICCGGPSLKAQLPFLKKWKNRAIIFSGGSATKLLVDEGIHPHFTFTVDPSREEYRRQFYNKNFEGISCYNLRVNPSVLEIQHGKKIYVSNQIFWKLMGWFEERLKITNYPRDGGIFSTSLCIDLARRMGFINILCVGLDLSSPSKEEGTFESAFRGNENLLKKECLQKNIHDELVKTQWEFVVAKAWIEEYAQHYPSHQFVNLSPYGLKIEGVENVSLKEAEKKYLKRSFDTTSFAYSVTEELNEIESASTEIKQLIDTLRSSFLKCKKILKKLLRYIEEDFSTFQEVKVEAENKLKEELAFSLVLQDQNRLIKAYLKRKADRVLLDPKATFTERELSYKHYMVEVYNFLLKSVNTHLKAIHERSTFSSS